MRVILCVILLAGIGCSPAFKCDFDHTRGTEKYYSCLNQYRRIHGEPLLTAAEIESDRRDAYYETLAEMRRASDPIVVPQYNFGTTTPPSYRCRPSLLDDTQMDCSPR